MQICKAQRSLDNPLAPEAPPMAILKKNFATCLCHLLLDYDLLHDEGEIKKFTKLRQNGCLEIQKYWYPVFHALYQYHASFQQRQNILHHRSCEKKDVDLGQAY